MIPELNIKRDEVLSVRPSEIVLGTKINRWEAISLPYFITKKGVNINHIDLRCECGNTATIKVSDFLSSRSKGCRNCANKYKKTDQELIDTSINSIYIDYKASAHNRGYTFEISKDFLKKLIFQKCQYCGNEPQNTRNNLHTVLKYNGIDRVINTIGYIEENCITCCATCNRMKNIYEPDFLLEHIQKILKNQQVSKIKNLFSEKKLSKFHERAMVIASQSPDQDTKVAALLIDENTTAVLAEGYNGFVRNAPDDLLPKTRPDKYPYMIHAEMNMICNSVRSGVKTDSRIVYCTLSPCITCLRTLWQAGVNTVYFKDLYKDFESSLEMGDLIIEIEKTESFYCLTMTTDKQEQK